MLLESQLNQLKVYGVADPISNITTDDGEIADFSSWDGSNDSATGSLSVSVTDTPPALDSIELLFKDPTSRGHITDVVDMKRPGTDQLPEGIIFNSSINRIDIPLGAKIDELSGWDLRGCFLTVSGSVGKIHDCYISEPDNGSTYLLDFYETASIGVVSRCTFEGNGFESTLAAIWYDRVSSSSPTIGVVERNAFFNMPSDTLKIAHGQSVIRHNYFDTPINMPYEPAHWNAGTNYQEGELVFTEYSGKRYAFKSVSSGNIGNPPPNSKQNNEWWVNQDPHVDTINCYLIPERNLVVRENFINLSNKMREFEGGYCWGSNNSLRVVRNNDDEGPMLSGTFEYNIMLRDSIESFPVQLPNLDDGISEAQTLKGNWITPSAEGSLYYTDDDKDNYVYGNEIYTGSSLINSVIDIQVQGSIPDGEYTLKVINPLSGGATNFTANLVGGQATVNADFDVGYSFQGMLINSALTHSAGVKGVTV